MQRDHKKKLREVERIREGRNNGKLVLSAEDKVKEL